MASITVQPEFLLERILTLEIVRVTERAAVSSARLRGHGKDKASDQAAVDAMRRELNKLPIDGTVVIGEGEIDEAPMLFIGEKVGTKHGPKVDIAVDPLEGTDAVRQEHAGRDRDASPWRMPARCCTRPTATCRRSPSARAIRRAPSISTRRPTRTSCGSPRPRASSRRKSPPFCSTGRAMPT